MKKRASRTQFTTQTQQKQRRPEMRNIAPRHFNCSIKMKKKGRREGGFEYLIASLSLQSILVILVSKYLQIKKGYKVMMVLEEKYIVDFYII
jgi:hypothetical protein